MYLPFISTDKQTVLGHYALAQVTGSLIATPAAGDVHASIRWAPALANTYFVLLKLRLGWSVVTAISTSVRMAWQAAVARSFTVDFSASNTQANLASVAKTNTMRSGLMPSSLLGTKGPQIATTGSMTGQTFTLDTSPFAMIDFTPPGIKTGVLGTPAGVAGATQTLYERGPDGFHPVVLANNEGIAVTLTHAGWADGTVSVYTEWTWAEVLSF